MKRRVLTVQVEQDKQVQRERKAEEKQEAKVKREQEKASKAELKRLAKAEKHRSLLDRPHEDQEERPRAGETVAMNSSNQPVSIPRPESPPAMPDNVQGDEDADQTFKSPKSGKMKTWLRSHFSRPSRSSDEEKSDKRGFIGGAALTGMGSNDSLTSVDSRSASMRAMAMAGRDQQSRGRASSREQPLNSGRNEDEVSPLSSSSEDDNDCFSDAPEPPTAGLTPPRDIRDSSTKTHSPARDSRFREII